MASTTFSGPVAATNSFVLTPSTVSALPAATSVPIGTTYFITDAATNVTLGTSDGTIWRRADTGLVVS